MQCSDALLFCHEKKLDFVMFLVARSNIEEFTKKTVAETFRFKVAYSFLQSEIDHELSLPAARGQRDAV